MSKKRFEGRLFFGSSRAVVISLTGSEYILDMNWKREGNSFIRHLDSGVWIFFFVFKS